MTKSMLLRRAIRLALANAAAASVAVPAIGVAADQQQVPASAADQPATAAPAPALQEVVVTGSRISIPGLHAVSPVTAISAKAITQSGATSVEDVLNQLPQVVASNGSMDSNGSSGIASVDLRGLGPRRTLVLINGRRLMPGDISPSGGVTNVADINNIPTPLIERVDVLTGGASSVYGADAVAGVVNFVMKDHFSGFEIDADASAYQHDNHEGYFGGLSPAAGFGTAPSSVMDGGAKDLTFIIGSDFAGGKGNAVGYLTWRKMQPVVQDSRDFSRCTLDTNSKGVVSCSGSSTSAKGGFFATDPPGRNGYDFALYESTINAAGQFTPFVKPNDLFNFGFYNYYQRPDERWNGGYFAHYNIDDNHQVFSEFMMMSDRTVSQVAPSGAFLASGLGVNPVTGEPDGGWAVNCNNPLLSANEQAALCTNVTYDAKGNPISSVPNSTGEASVVFGRRNVEGGNRRDDLTHTSYRMVIGSKGSLTDNLTYDAYFQEGITLLADEFTNDVSKSRLEYALNVVKDPSTGQVVCAANANGANGAPGCVPYNIWTPGAVTPAAEAYISGVGLEQGRTEERVYHVDFTYDGTSAGIKLPTASEGMVANFGAEYRAEFAQLNPDQEYQTADLAGQGQKILPLNAALGVKEAFVEARLPLVQDKPFAKEISINPGYRYSKYDLGFSTNTFKLMADWSPTSDFRFRGGYNRAVRAPNLGELFAENRVALDGSEDPCASSGFGSTATASLAQCQAHGVTAVEYGQSGMPGNPAGQYNGFVGGNPHLKPETADTYTFGVVYTPTYLPSLSATIDYYDIKIKNVISSYGANLIVNQCTFNNNPFFCSLVHRDSSGSIWFSDNGYVLDPTENLGYEQERGLDLQVNYREDLGRFGAVDYSLYGTYIFDQITEPYPASPGVPASGTYNCAGYFGATCGNPLPKWKHIATATWETPVRSLDVGLRWRHFGNTEIDTASPSPLLKGTVLSSYQYTGSRDYLDLNASYMVFSGVQVMLGVNNVLDKDPPVLPTSTLTSVFFNGNTFPQVYDTLGRYMFVNIKADF